MGNPDFIPLFTEGFENVQGIVNRLNGITVFFPD